MTQYIVVMNVHSVDERDSVEEMNVSGYRVMLLREGRRVSAFNLDDTSVTEAQQWALQNCGDGKYSLAARFDNSGGGVTLMWLTPPPEVLLDTLGF